MKFFVIGDHPERFDAWIARYNSRNKRKISLDDREFTVDDGQSIKIGMQAAGDTMLYEIIQPDGSFPATLLGEIAAAFPDLEFEATHGEFQIRNRSLLWKPIEDPDDGVPPPSS